MMLRLLFVAIFVASPLGSQAASAQANPIRKVVSMLQMMVEKVEAEGEKQEKLFNKFMCYCKNGKGALEKSIADAENKAPELASSIEEGESKKVQLEESLKSHKEDRTAAKKAIADATAIREKEAKTFAALNAEESANVEAMGAAITAIEKGMSGFLQTNTASQVKAFVMSKQNIPDVDRQDLLSFFSASEGYSPASDQIVGILKQLKDETTADLAAATKDEETAIADFEALVGAKNKEISALTASIESKTQRVGELAVEIVEMKNALGDTQEALEEDKKYLADLEKSCGTKAAEWEEIKKTRAEELTALHETIKVLNDDDALDLFKKTLPSPKLFLLQVADGNKQRKERAFALIEQARKTSPNVGFDFIALALKGQSKGFDKVIKMIDDMVATLKQEQVDDDKKKDYCNAEFDSSDDKKKALERTVSDLETAIADTQDGIGKAGEEIAALNTAIKALDKMVAEATEQRKEENADYTDLMSSNTAAKQLMDFAKNRLNKFYNPKLYKPPPARELTEEQRITQNMGGSIEPTAPPGGIAGTGIGAFVQIRAHRSSDREAPPPPPETFSGYNKKGEESNGVMAMIDLLIADLDKEMQEAKVEEKNAQEEYEQMMADSKEKRAQDSKSLTDTTAEKTRLEEELQNHEDDKKSASTELMETEQYISNLHGECDWLVKYFDARKEARVGEVDSLNNAKAVLSGADYSFIQSGSLRGTRRN